ncbi:MAG: Rap1a/Tai family immunity protein [Pseudolabrys sp.]
MRAKLLGAAALLGAIVTNAPSYVQETAAQETTITAYQGGEELTRTCRVFMQWRRTGRATPQEAFDAASCYAFVTGVVDTFNFQEKTLFQTFSGGPICLPEKINLYSLTEIVATFLDQNAALRHYSGVELVLRAFAHSLPCKK